jgi:hypothetical protein
MGGQIWLDGAANAVESSALVAKANQSAGQQCRLLYFLLYSHNNHLYVLSFLIKAKII